MVVFPNAKINIGLDIVSKRADGYHNLMSCFYPVPFCDILEILPSEQMSFVSTGIDIPGEHDDNLCLKAINLLRKDHDFPNLAMHLHKIIPIGAGLGGGSSDASYVLRSVNEMFNLNIDNTQLEGYASKLGSDCPFFIENKPVIASETGTTFIPSSMSLSQMYIIILYIGTHISTAEAYANVKPAPSRTDFKSLNEKNISDWQGSVKNDFESSIFPNHSDLEILKENLYKGGASYASMTGSGSAVYGIFDREVEYSGPIVWQGWLP